VRRCRFPNPLRRGPRCGETRRPPGRERFGRMGRSWAPGQPSRPVATERCTSPVRRIGRDTRAAGATDRAGWSNTTAWASWSNATDHASRCHATDCAGWSNATEPASQSKKQVVCQTAGTPDGGQARRHGWHSVFWDARSSGYGHALGRPAFTPRAWTAPQSHPRRQARPRRDRRGAATPLRSVSSPAARPAGSAWSVRTRPRFRPATRVVRVFSAFQMAKTATRDWCCGRLDSSAQLDLSCPP
jgi:hypothetical protein